MQLKPGEFYRVTLSEATFHCKINSGDIVLYAGQTMRGSFAWQHQFNLVKDGKVVERNLGLCSAWCTFEAVEKID